MYNLHTLITACDTLVKEGAISPQYAAGFKDTLTKQAGIFTDSPDANLRQEMDAFKDKNGRYPVGDELDAVIDSSRHWWTDIGQRSGTYLGNRWNKLKSFFSPTSNRTSKSFDKELEAERAKYRHAYMAKNKGALTLEQNKSVASWEDYLNKLLASQAQAEKDYMSPTEWKFKHPNGIKNIDFSPETRVLQDAAPNNPQHGYRLKNNYNPVRRARYGVHGSRWKEF